MKRDAELDPSKAWTGRTLNHERMLLACRFSPCGRHVVAGGADGRLHRWEIETEKKASFGPHDGWVVALAFSPDGKRLFTADFHGTLAAWPWDEEDPKPVWTVKGAHRGGACALAASSDGALLATGGHDGRVRLWSAPDGKPVRELAGHGAYVYSVAFHPRGKALASGDLLGSVKHWDLETGTAARDLDARVLHTREEDFLADVGGVRAMAFSRDGGLLACAGLSNAKSNTFCPGQPTVAVLDWAGGKAAHVLRVAERADGTINGLRFLADGTLAAAGEGMSGGGLWFARPGAAEFFHAVPGTSGYDLDLHPDGLRLATPVFEPRGRGGNGRHAGRGEYIPNGGAVRITNLFAPPAKAAPPKKK